MGAFEKVLPGQRTRVYAEEKNLFIDAALAHRKRPTDVPSRPIARASRSLTVVVQPNVAVDQGEVLAYGPIMIRSPDNLNLFRTDPTFAVAVPAAEDWGNFIIAAEPIKADAPGRGALQGVVAARVDIRHASHRYADIEAGSRTLQSGLAGTAKILDQEPGIGVRWCAVLLGAQYQSVYAGIAQGEIVKGNTGTVRVGTWDQDDVEFDMFFRAADANISGGREVAIRWFEGERLWRVMHAQCEEP